MLAAIGSRQPRPWPKKGAGAKMAALVLIRGANGNERQKLDYER
jgi:hypothetical protein